MAAVLTVNAGSTSLELRLVGGDDQLLAAGASLAAILDGRSVDTTMGFTPVEGLVMATRSGSVDPGRVVRRRTAEKPQQGQGRRTVASFRLRLEV